MSAVLSPFASDPFTPPVDGYVDLSDHTGDNGLTWTDHPASGISDNERIIVGGGLAWGNGWEIFANNIQVAYSSGEPAGPYFDVTFPMEWGGVASEYFDSNLGVAFALDKTVLTGVRVYYFYDADTPANSRWRLSKYTAGVETILDDWYDGFGPADPTTRQVRIHVRDTQATVLIDGYGRLSSAIPEWSGAVAVWGVRTGTPGLRVGTLRATPVRGFTDCGAYVGGQECEIRVYDGDGDRTLLALGDWAESVQWEQIERGGFGAASIQARARWEDLSLTGNEQVDIYLFGEPAYRGWVRVASNEVNPDDSASLQVYGLVERLDHWTVQRKFAYGALTDISAVFTDIVNHAVAISGRLPTITIDTELIGATLKEFDARGKSVAEAINQLCDIAPEQCIWGGGFADTADWRGYRDNRIYLLKRNTTVASVYAVGDNVTAFVYPRDVSKVQNLLRLTGGKVSQPNLVTNGSFEDLRPADEVVGNLLLNPGFEDPVYDALYWDLAAGTWVQAPGGPVSGSPRSGSHFLVVDATTQRASQTVYCVPLLSYRASCWARLQAANQPNGLILTLQGLASDNSVLTTTSDVWNAGSTPALNTEVYQRFETPALNLASYPTATKVKVTAQSTGGNASSDGVECDDFGLYQSNAAAQDMWRIRALGTATIDDIDWAATGPVAPRSGGLCVKVQAAGVGTGEGSDYVELYITNEDAISIKPWERYTLLVAWHTNNIGAPGDAVLSIGCRQVKSDGTETAVLESLIGYGAAAGWSTRTFALRTAQDCAKLAPFIRLRTTRDVWIDDVMLVQGEAPTDYTVEGCWWDGETFSGVIDVTSSDLTSLLSTDVKASITNYGVREQAGGIQVEGVTDYDSFLAYAEDHLSAYALPQIIGQLSIEGPRELLPQSGDVKIIGLPQGPQALFPTRIRYSVDTVVRLQADLESIMPDMADLLLMLRDRTLRSAASAGSKTAAGGASSSGGGGSVSTWPDPEVVEARSSVLLGDFNTLDARLEAIEAALGLGGVPMENRLDFEWVPNSQYLALAGV